MIAFDRPGNATLLIRLSGNWTIHGERPPHACLLDQIASTPLIRRVTFDTTKVTGWDSSFLTFLIKLLGECGTRDIDVDKDGLPFGVVRLLDLATAVPERAGARREAGEATFTHNVGSAAIGAGRYSVDTLAFVGEVFTAFVSLLRGRARFQWRELFLVMEEVGVRALPIITLISLLVGFIFAFISSIQLKLFGAEVYIADLVGIAMVRAMGSIMTGIIMAGRTGAAFAARLGTMQVNEEIDALRTVGIPPVEFLVLPRMIALGLMMPLLCLYADFMGILGGMIVGSGFLGVNAFEYYTHTREAVGLNDFAVGLFMGAVFGVLVALFGCMKGLQCGRSASAVGTATTSAVVTSIVGIIVATALITVIVTVLGI